MSQCLFLYKVFNKGICVKLQQEKTTRLRDLILFVGLPDFYKAFTFLGVQEASLHHLTVEFNVFRIFVFLT